MIRTKIIVTYGPSLNDFLTLKKTLKYADIVRINFSHGDHASWLNAKNQINKASKEIGKEIALLADLPGPKIRLGTLVSPIKVSKGEIVTFAYGEKREGIVPVEYKYFHLDAEKDRVIDIGDGIARFMVSEIKGGMVICRAVDNGVLSSRKGISIIGAKMMISAPTVIDYKYTKFALKNSFDYVGMSFVKSADDIKRLRSKNKDARIIAKIEKKEAVDKIDEIADEADGIMVARGDLALDVSLEHIPEMQRIIIDSSRRAGKPVIVATQMLASMINNPEPTRAEVNDIAGAVIEGADCLMLSDETTIGKYPVEAAWFLVKTAKVAEQINSGDNAKSILPKITAVNMGIAFAAADFSDQYKTDCIFIPTQKGKTAKLISKFRPNTRLIALSQSEKVRKLLSMYYGIRAMPIKSYKSIDQMLNRVKKIASEKGIKNYIIVSGKPNISGSTHTLSYIEG